MNRYNIKHEEVDVGFDYSQLIAKKIDAQWAFRTTAGLNLPEKGVEVNVISPQDYGIHTHGYTIFTTEELIENHPEVVERFLRATIKGIAYTLENPDDALQSTLDRDAKLNPILERKRLRLYNEVISNSEEYPIGYMDEEMFKETYDRLREENVIEQEFDVNEAFATEFLEKIYS